ncbi:tetratricopeptide repeat protein [Mucilaginibacter sp. AW1-3]
MKIISKLFFALFILCCVHFPAKAQNADLIKQGIELHNQGKYAEAIDKFNEVLKTDAENSYANYEMAFSLYAAKKPKDAIPYLQKAVRSDNTSLRVTAYSLLASIYDADNQSQKAIETYNQAIKINPDYPQIYYNLGLAYSRNKQYAEAESSAIEAIKHDPKNAASQRLYALATFHQNKRINALLGFCSFLLLEPTGPRATEAYGNIQHILQGGVLSGTSSSAQQDKETNSGNQSIAQVVKSGQAKKLTGADLLEYELKGIFNLAWQLSEKRTDKGLFDHFFAAYFYKLAQSNHMPAFTHTIVLGNNTDDSSKWAAGNPAQVTALMDWLKTTERGL